MMFWKNEQYLRNRNNVNENKNEQTVELFVCIIKNDSYEFHPPFYNISLDLKEDKTARSIHEV